MSSGVYWNQPVCPSMCQSVRLCTKNTSFCQSAGGGIKSQLVTAVVSATFNVICKCFHFGLVKNFVVC